MENITAVPGEEEILITAGTEFVIKSVEWKVNRYEIEMEYFRSDLQDIEVIILLIIILIFKINFNTFLYIFKYKLNIFRNLILFQIGMISKDL